MHPAVQPIHQDEPHRHHRLILVRPGDAIDRRAWPGPPETRQLSAKGPRSDGSRLCQRRLAGGATMLRGLRTRRSGGRSGVAAVESELASTLA